MISLGIDVGGANTKAILLENGKVGGSWFRYIPLWKRKEELTPFFKSLMETIDPDIVGATLTGELSDVFETKSDGVREIVGAVCGVFGDDICLFITLDGELLTRDRSIASPLKLAAANWVASSLVIGREYSDCTLVDVGSTTTDIIPIKKGKPVPLGKTDFRRLESGELVYTGILRTPLSSICSEISVYGKKVRIAAENFSITADVYKVLDMIGDEDYTCETPDGRGKSEKECIRRIARMLCSDLEELEEDLVIRIAEGFHKRQIDLVKRAMEKVISTYKISKATEVVVTGLGRKILAEKVARAIGFKKIIDLANVYGKEVATMTPAFGVGLLASQVSEGGCSS